MPPIDGRRLPCRGARPTVPPRRVPVAVAGSRPADGAGGDVAWRRRGEQAGAPADPGAVEADPEAALVARVARGDHAAFAELYDRLAPTVFGIARAVVRDPAMAEEVTQEVLLEVWRSAPRHDPSRGRARTWVVTIAHRRAVDRVRSEQAGRDRADRVAVGEHDVVASASTAVLDDLDRQRVRQALDALTPVQREAVTLAYYGGHTYAEVARLLDCPEGTVKTRIRDGLIRLRDHLGVTA